MRVYGSWRVCSATQPSPLGRLVHEASSLLAAEWGLLTFARKGSLYSGKTLKDLIGGDGWRARPLLLDICFGLALWGGVGKALGLPRITSLELAAPRPSRA